MVDESLQPYIYRVRSTMPQAGEFVPINVGRDDNNDSDWGEASGQVLGTGTVGITPAMAVLGNFTASIRTTRSGRPATAGRRWCSRRRGAPRSST